MTRRARRVTLDGARVLLTGASSGIGRELAVRLAAQGAQLVVVARRADLLEALGEEIASAGYMRPYAIPTDLSAPGAAAKLATAALDQFGDEIDMLINNAGGSLVGAQSRLGDDATARVLYEINFWTPLALSKEVIPTMLASGSGTIVNVTSTIQSVPLPLLGGYYGSSKSALAQATRALRLELAETPLRVVEVIPGATDTALRDIDELPWKGSPPKTLPPVSAESSAAAIVRGLKRGKQRIVYPSYSLAPLEFPAIGRLIARIGGRRVNTRGALELRTLTNKRKTP
ncbi:SDR family NAD(P)-dependent oxidoreductase [Mycobacterium vicinigordonae]|uniref:SDR family NAD(P)-dependent oxidoreductase n=1 Tax=Mycobacterium vicinigordonae TaxID=1719132 RepID=A0A7D6HSA2_9MYCO|nr:SDR family NAD(P)-dependent oxidoreductase [Mycobacterium vicinigordonae]QLL05333.1 SDR family NAD(P)-dependent oxidoreductase [Mycobacterium vicinigordonae]